MTTALVVAQIVAGCSAEAPEGPAKAEAPAAVMVDRPLDPARTEILGIALEAASALPVRPHLKTRSRLQLEVAEASLGLERPVSAKVAIARIADWRQGLGQAELALYLAERGDRTGARERLVEAEAWIEKMRAEETGQAWRVDRIRAVAARCRGELGDAERMAELEAGLGDTEWGSVSTRRAAELAPEGFDDMLKALDGIFLAASLDQAKSALETYAALHARFYADPKRRAELEERVRSTYDKIPMDIRVAMISRMAENAIAHDDDRNALALLDDAERLMATVPWLPEHRVPVAARIGALRHAAGAEEAGRAALEEARRLFAEERERIVDIFRAGALWPLAESYAAIGDAEAARAVYRRALEECVINPNSRPRAEDLVAICCSIVLRGPEPDDSLMTMIRTVREGLGDPW